MSKVNRKKEWRKFIINWTEGNTERRGELISDLNEEEMQNMLNAFDVQIKHSEKYEGKINV